MPIPGIPQPELIEIDDTLRLRKFDGVFDFAFEWYQDTETVYLVDGVKKPYTMETLNNMYRFLDRRSELYFIEVLRSGMFIPIGDVAFRRDDMPIVLGKPEFRRRGIGRKVIEALIRRGRELGYDRLRVGEIYDYNTASRACFESLGFRAYEKTETGHRFELKLK